MPKLGRPALPIEEKRVPISTTLPLPIVQEIQARRLKYNELIMDGLEHRETCTGLYEKIGRLQAVIDKMRDSQ